MLKRFLEWFEPDARDAPQARVELAAAVLLVEVIMADHDMAAEEEAMLAQRISATLGLDESEVALLMDEARTEQAETLDLYQYTRVVNERMGVLEKYDLLTDLWMIAWANGEIDKYEDAMIRKISDLLYMAHADFMRAKHEARERIFDDP